MTCRRNRHSRHKNSRSHYNFFLAAALLPRQEHWSRDFHERRFQQSVSDVSEDSENPLRTPTAVFMRDFYDVSCSDLVITNLLDSISLYGLTPR